MKKKLPNENYLDIVFQQNNRFHVEESEDGQITIFVENKGAFNRIAQLLFKKPKVSQIHLEEFGNFIWKQIDGKLTVYEISQKVHEHFGEKAEPLIPRLVQYFKMLENYGFIERLCP